MKLTHKEILRLPIWRGFSLAFLLLFLLLILIEVLTRTSLYTYLPVPSTGVDSFIFDAKIAYLEREIIREGDIDCLIVGSSMANNGLDPTKISTAYESITAEKLRCFNMGIPTLTLGVSGPLAKGLVNRYNPKIVVFLISPRDFVPKYGYHKINRSPWLLQNIGDYSLKGWLTNYSYGYRYFLSLQYWLLPANRGVMRQDFLSMTPQGYSALYETREPNSKYPPMVLYDFNEPESQVGLSSLLDISVDVDLIVIDAPVYSGFYSSYLYSPENYNDNYLSVAEEIFDVYGVPFLKTEDMLWRIPEDGWGDLIHLNEKGEPVFSAWVGDTLAQLYPDGILR